MKMIQPVTLNMTVIAAHIHNCLVVLFKSILFCFKWFYECQLFAFVNNYSSIISTSLEHMGIL